MQKKKKEAKAQVEPTAHLRATSGPTSCTCRRRAEHEQQHRPRPGQHTPPGTHTSETRPPEPCTMPLPPLLFHYHLLLASVLLPIKHLRRKIATKYSVPALPLLLLCSSSSPPPSSSLEDDIQPHSKCRQCTLLTFQFESCLQQD